MLSISPHPRAARDTDVARSRLASIPPPGRLAPLHVSSVDPLAGSGDEQVAGPAPGPAGPPQTPSGDGSPTEMPLPSRAGDPNGGVPALRRWLPGVLREARLVAPRQAVVGLVAAALLSAVATALALWAVRPHGSVVGPPPLVSAGLDQSAGSGRPASPAGSAGAAPAAHPLVLAVVGRVRRPGLVTLPPGSRVIDALKAAGGVLPGVDLTSLNLARKVVDGEQVVVGAPASAGPGGGAGPSGSAAPGSPSAPVNLNTATAAELDALPGIGPVMAQRILDWRAAHGGFTSVEQLGDVSGIGDRLLERLRGLVTV